MQFTALSSTVALALMAVASAYVVAPLKAHMDLASDSTSFTVLNRLLMFVI